MAVLQVGTQGRGGVFDLQRVTLYTLRYKRASDVAEQSVRGADGNLVVFSGNQDSGQLVVNDLPKVVEARFVKLQVVAYFRHPSLRWELYGYDIEV